jgi:predicted RNase H-like HicB family nuclease
MSENLVVNVMVWPEDGVYIAKCPENSVASQGLTEQEAIDNLREALELYYEDSATGYVASRMTTLEIAL